MSESEAFKQVGRRYGVKTVWIIVHLPPASGAWPW